MKIRNIWNQKESTKHKIIVYFILIFFTVLFNGAYLTLNYLTNNDEFSSIASIVSICGKDWSSLASESSYHGFGGIIYLIPFLKIFPSINIYKCIQIGCLVLRVFCVIITYELGLELLKCEKSKAVILAIVCNIGTLQPDASAALSAMTEVPVTFVTLMISYLVFLCFKNDKNRVYFLALAGFLAGFASSIHSRIIIMYFSIIICMFLAAFMNRKIWKSLILFVMSFVMFYFLFKILIDKVNSNVYLVSDSKELVTSTSGILKTRLLHYIFILFDFKKNAIIVKTFFAQLGNYTFLSFGMIWILLLSNLLFIISEVKKIKNKTIEKQERLQLLLTIFGCINLFVMMISICISSTGQVVQENYRWYSYLRYSLPYSWIFVLTGFSKLRIETISHKVVFVMMVLLPSLFIKYILSVICQDLDSSGYKMSYNIFNRIFYFDGSDAFVYYSRMGAIIITCLVISFVLTIVFNKNRFINIIYLVASLAIGVSIFVYFVDRDKTTEDMVASSISYINNNSSMLENKTMYIIGNARYKYNVQLKCPNMVLYSIEDVDEIECQNYIVFCDKKIKSLEDNHIMVQLDNNEYFYSLDTER